MSQNDTETQTPPDVGNETDTGAKPEAQPAPSADEKAKRDVWPIRMFVVGPDGELRHVPEAGTFTRNEQAYRWIDDSGATDVAYFPARCPEKARRPNPRTFTEVLVIAARKEG